ncbi:MAG: hypothetical protein A2033_10110 [Bacteroidetes bacterium GWA2_31_9]|nr:MAG: hypothetical protein A2033_10110 [Bacteroidetes bacterium GWA2_31_9]
MKNILIETITNVCDALNKYDVKYLIIGGTAVALHGHYRISTASDGSPLNKYDLDFWYRPGYENSLNLLKALEELGYNVKELKSKSPDPKKTFYSFEFDIYKADFLPSVPGLDDFMTSYNRKERYKIKEVDVYVISFDDLIISKQTKSRSKDIEDIHNLKSKKQSNDNTLSM